MKKLIVGDKIAFEIAYHPFGVGLVNATSDGVEIENLFRAALDLDSNQTPVLELSGYLTDDDGKLISAREIDEDGVLTRNTVEKTTRKFIVSGKIELILEEGVCDETTPEEHLGVPEEDV